MTVDELIGAMVALGERATLDVTADRAHEEEILAGGRAIPSYHPPVPIAPLEADKLAGLFEPDDVVLGWCCLCAITRVRLAGRNMGAS